jgi:hypothetical protein
LELTGVVALVVIESMDEVDVGVGLKVPEAPAGRPLTERSTEPANPPEDVMMTL